MGESKDGKIDLADLDPIRLNSPDRTYQDGGLDSSWTTDYKLGLTALQIAGRELCDPEKMGLQQAKFVTGF